MAFKSAVDGWYYIVVAMSGAAAVLAFALTLATGRPSQIAIGLGILLLGAGLPLWLLLSTDYRVDAHTLKVRSGPFHWTIPLAEISAVRESNSVLSSPALSLKRLKIVHGRGRTILLSPADRDGFMKAIGRKIDKA
jgi:Bacterial PH domain